MPEALRRVKIPSSEPDAALIAACAEYPARVAENNLAPDSDGDDGPAWIRYAACRDAISNATPQTMAGLLAKARVAKIDAVGPDGKEQVDGSMGQVWAWDLVNDLLRLYGAVPRELPRATDALLLERCRAHMALQRAEMEACIAYGTTTHADPDYSAAEKAWQAADDAVDHDLDELMAIGAGTVQGFLAKARCVWAYWERNARNISGGPFDLHEEAAFAVLRDAARLSGEVRK